MTDTKEIQTRRGWSQPFNNRVWVDVGVGLSDKLPRFDDSGEPAAEILVTIPGATHAEIEAQIERLRGVCRWKYKKWGGSYEHRYLRECDGKYTDTDVIDRPCWCGKRVEVV